MRILSLYYNFNKQNNQNLISSKIFNSFPFLTKMIPKKTSRETKVTLAKTIWLKFIRKVDCIDQCFCAIHFHEQYSRNSVSPIVLACIEKSDAFSGVNAPCSMKRMHSNFLNCNLSWLLISHLARPFFCYQLYGLGN